MNKYRNKKVIVDEKEFDSKREGNRYKELKLLESAVDTYKDLYEKERTTNELNEILIGALQKRTKELEEQIQAYKTLLKNELERSDT